MSSLWDIPYIVVDVETTGSDPKNNRITDIACVKVINGEIVSEFSSLINPHQLIPPFIVKMTGITHDMVIQAPEANDVLSKVYSLFADGKSIFVAHNARFDFNFVNQSLIREGFNEIPAELVCTLKLARRLLPAKQKKNVGALADYFNIPVTNRHRALGDASATAKFLIQLLENAESEHAVSSVSELLKFQNIKIRHFHAPPATTKRVEPILAELPDSPGVYRFLNRKNQILYIGKAKSLKDRVKSYFHNDTFTSKKIAEMFKRIHKIKWDCVPTELEALLLESREIKKHKPPYNTVDKKYRSYPFVKLTTNDDYPLIKVCDSIEPDGAEYYGPIRSMALAEDIVKNVEKRFKIRKCENKLKPSEENKPCFYFYIEQCQSPCSNEITKEEYTKEIERVKLYLTGLPEGIISQLENKMNYFAENLEFEKAESVKRNIYELKKLFTKDDKVPTSVNKNNLILLIPASDQEKTIDLFVIKSGMLRFQKTIGRKAKLNHINKIIHNTYFNGSQPVSIYTKEDIDEIRIISNWINKQNGKANHLYIEGKTEKEITEDLEFSVRNIQFEEEDQKEYSE